MEVLALMVPMVLLVLRVETMTRASSELCYYQPYYKQLTCTCSHDDQMKESNYLGLKMIHYVRTLGQEVRSVVVHSCEHLTLGLDFKGVNPTDIPVTVQRSGKVRLDFIIFDPTWADQTLQLNFKNVENVTFSQLHLDHVSFLSAVDVKYFGISETTFVNMSEGSVSINNCHTLRVTRSIFLNLAPDTFQISRTRHVIFMDNQMNLNAMSAISTKESSNLYISCNRQTGYPVTPECKHSGRSFRIHAAPATTRTSTTSTSTTTRTTVAEVATTEPRLMFAAPLNTSSDLGKHRNANTESWYLGILLCLFVSLALLVTVMVSVFRSDQPCRTLKVSSPKEIRRRYEIPPPPPLPLPSPGPARALPRPLSEQPRSGHKMDWCREMENNKLFNKVRLEIDGREETT